MRSVYFDHNATTSLDSATREAMMPFLGEIYGNPSSVHHLGRKARAILDDAHDRMAAVWKCKPSEVVFTSGGTEANNLAIFGAARTFRDKGRHIITSSIEHHAVLHPCEYLANKEGFELTTLPVNAEGIVDPQDLADALRPDTVLVSIMAANNETGSIQPIAKLGEICREQGVLFHTDAIQWFGKVPLETINEFNADFVSCCAHKFHGPKGAGALFIKSPLLPDPLFFGGGHENERRAGTENLAGIMGLVDASERFVREPVFDAAALKPLADRLKSGCEAIEGVAFRGSERDRLPNTVSFSVEGCDSIAMLAGLDMEGICASSGSACTSGSVTPSHVLSAMGVDEVTATSLVRLSLGRDSTADEVEYVRSKLPEVIAQIRGG